MRQIITKAETEDCLRQLLKKEGYKLNSKRGLYKIGPDIKATRDNQSWCIEAIGEAESGIERVKDFYQAFFQAISRLNNKSCEHIVIALPEISRKFMPIRAKIYKVAWERIAGVFPELEIWLVDSESKSYQKTFWGYWLKHNK